MAVFFAPAPKGGDKPREDPSLLLSWGCKGAEHLRESEAPTVGRRASLPIERFRSIGVLQAFRLSALFMFAGQLADNVSNDEAQNEY